MKIKQNDQNPKSKLGTSNKKIKGFVIAGALIALAVGVGLVMATSNSPTSKLPVSNLPASTSVPHDAMGMMHIHTHLSLVIDGKAAVVPANIGIDPSMWKDHTLDSYGMSGMAPLHTHKDDGVIHVESYKDRDFTLGQFLDIQGIQLNGYNVKMTVDGNPVSDYRNHILKDGEQITLDVTK